MKMQLTVVCRQANQNILYITVLQIDTLKRITVWDVYESLHKSHCNFLETFWSVLLTADAGFGTLVSGVTSLTREEEELEVTDDDVFDIFIWPLAGLSLSSFLFFSVHNKRKWIFQEEAKRYSDNSVWS